MWARALVVVKGKLFCMCGQVLGEFFGSCTGGYGSWLSDYLYVVMAVVVVVVGLTGCRWIWEGVLLVISFLYLCVAVLGYTFDCKMHYFRKYVCLKIYICF